MIKKRTPTPSPSAINSEIDKRIEEFASAADGIKPAQEKVLDEDAKRDYKAIRVPFNEYEYGVLEKLVKKTNRSKLNLIRHAILKLAESELSD